MRLSFLLLLILISFHGYNQARYIHVLVALCDNDNQRIVPVPRKIGNGQDPANNLYWGAGFGVKTFFKKQSDWRLIKQIKNPTGSIYERLLFKHRDSMIYMVADAYNGAMIRETTWDFLNYASGIDKITIAEDSIKIKAGGAADLLCYVGHDGLMDFSLDNYPAQVDKKLREVVILACSSKRYFNSYVKKTGAYPLLWTSNLMCPEAYTLDAAIDSWILQHSHEKIREQAALAYNKYQKCGIKGARSLLVTGW